MFEVVCNYRIFVVTNICIYICIYIYLYIYNNLLHMQQKDNNIRADPTLKK